MGYGRITVSIGTALLVAASAVSGMYLPQCADAADLSRGEAAFLKNCIACHADGGNEINPEKTLSRKDRERFGIRTPEGIVRLMRNPGPGMLLFDEKTLSNEDARAIAEYIIATF